MPASPRAATYTLPSAPADGAATAMSGTGSTCHKNRVAHVGKACPGQVIWLVYLWQQGPPFKLFVCVCVYVDSYVGRAALVSLYVIT